MDLQRKLEERNRLLGEYKVRMCISLEIISPDLGEQLIVAVVQRTLQYSVVPPAFCKEILF